MCLTLSLYVALARAGTCLSQACLQVQQFCFANLVNPNTDLNNRPPGPGDQKNTPLPPSAPLGAGRGGSYYIGVPGPEGVLFVIGVFDVIVVVVCVIGLRLFCSLLVFGCFVRCW